MARETEGEKAIDTDPQDIRPAESGGRGWLGRGALACAAIAGVAFVAGFGWFANEVSRLRTPADPPPADAIIVLTGGQFRLDAAIDLLKSGKGKRLLISGVNPVARDAELRAVIGVDENLFACCVDIDRAAEDTIGNATESAKWVREHGYRSVILVTNNYHMPRSLLEMGRLLDGIALQPYPVVNSRIDQGGWLMKPDAVRVLFTEYIKFLTALVRGFLVPAVSSPQLAGPQTTPA